MWKCLKCNEKVEDQFESCWKCGADKTGVKPEGDINKSFAQGQEIGREIDSNDHLKTKDATPFVAQVLNILSLLGFVGGVVMAFVFWPSYAEYSGAYIASLMSIAAGITQAVIFAAFAKTISLLGQIELNTRKKSK